MQEQPNYYAVIPAEVRYAKIKANAKLLYGEITALTNKEGYCWATSSYFAELYGVSKVSIQDWLNELEKAGFIKRKNKRKKGSKEIEQRRIYLVKKTLHPSKENLTTPSKENLTENITSNNTTSNIISKDITTKVEYGDGDINEIVNYFKKTMDLPLLDGTIKSNRYSAKRLLIKTKNNIRAVKMLIDCLAVDEFHSQNASSLNYLEKHAVAIAQRARKNNKIGVVI